jgi:Golgi nucleoside diphosphatase
LADSGANTHVTVDPENIANPQPFDGRDIVGVGNGAGLVINGTSSSLVSSDSSNASVFHLKEIVHCPKASTNLLSINKFCRDNKCFFILTNSYFL